MKSVLNATIMDQLVYSLYSYHDTCSTNAKDSERAWSAYALITIDDAAIACKEIPPYFRYLCNGKPLSLSGSEINTACLTFILAMRDTCCMFG